MYREYVVLIVQIIFIICIFLVTIFYFIDTIFKYTLRDIIKKYYKKLILITFSCLLIYLTNLIYFLNNQNIKCTEEKRNNQTWFSYKYEKRNLCTINYKLDFNNIKVIKYVLMGWSTEIKENEKIYYVLLLSYNIKTGYSLEETSLYVDKEKEKLKMEKLEKNNKIFVIDSLKIKSIEKEKDKKVLKLLNNLRDDKLLSTQKAIES